MTLELETTTPESGARRRRISGPLQLAAGLGLATLVLIPFNPNTEHIPICPLKATTGLDCPGCGGLRCVHDLVTGHPAQAANQNILALTLLPFAVLLWVVWFLRRWRGDPRPIHINPKVLIGLGIVAVIFGIVRNLPFVPYLQSGLG